MLNANNFINPKKATTEKYTDLAVLNVIPLYKEDKLRTARFEFNQKAVDNIDIKDPDINNYVLIGRSYISTFEDSEIKVDIVLGFGSKYFEVSESTDGKIKSSKVNKNTNNFYSKKFYNILTNYLSEEQSLTQKEIDSIKNIDLQVVPIDEEGVYALHVLNIDYDYTTNTTGIEENGSVVVESKTISEETNDNKTMEQLSSEQDVSFNTIDREDIKPQIINKHGEEII